MVYKIGKEFFAIENKLREKRAFKLQKPEKTKNR